MARPKGGGRLGGKPKGYTDEATKAVRDVFKEAIELQYPMMIEAFKEAKEKDPIKYLDLIAKFSSFVMPKMIDITSKGEEMKQVFKIGDTIIEL